MRRAALLFTLALFTSGCGNPATSAPTPAAAPAPAPTPGINPAPDTSGDWVRPARDYASTRFSPLDLITAANVKQLSVKSTFSTGVLRGHEAAPIVVNNTMYIVTPWPNLVYALDLSKDGAPVKWKYEPKPLAAAQGVACCDVVNRGVVYADGTIVFNTLDNRTIALDSATGREKWVTKSGDVNKGETITMAPLVVKDKVLVGNSGGEMGVRGWLTALDASSGKIAWRAYSTGPDKDVLIGPRFKPFYASDRGTDLGNPCDSGARARGRVVRSYVWGLVAGAPHREALAFAVGWSALVLSILPPLDSLSIQYFSVHMIQHELMMLVGAPLLILGRPLQRCVAGLPDCVRLPVAHALQKRAVSETWRVLTAPLVAWALHGLAIWIWHMPALYDAAVGNEGIHTLQHAMFVGTSALFWWGMLYGRYGRAGYGAAVFYVFLTVIHTGILGAMVTFARTPLYPVYAAPAAAHGIDQLVDQQRAGLLMWIPAGLVMTLLGLGLFAAWLGESERRAIQNSKFKMQTVPGEEAP